jgi:hypothetical protein
MFIPISVSNTLWGVFWAQGGAAFPVGHILRAPIYPVTDKYFFSKTKY